GFGLLAGALPSIWSMASHRYRVSHPVRTHMRRKRRSNCGFGGSGSGSGCCGREGCAARRRSIRQGTQPELDFLLRIALEIAALPLIVVHQAMPHLGITLVMADIAVPAVGLEDGNDVDGIRSRQRSIAFDDQQVVVVLARCLEAQVV